MGKKISISWQGDNYRARYQVDSETGVIRDLNGQTVTKGDAQLIIAQLAIMNKRDIGAKVRKHYFGN